MSKVKKTLLTTACMWIATGMITLGCSPERLEESQKPKIEYPGMPSYNTNDEFSLFNVRSYVTDLLSKNKLSAKKGLKSKIPLDGDIVSLKTYYEHGIPKDAEKDKDGFYPTECTGIIQIKELRRLNSKEMSRTPPFTKDGMITVIDYDNGLDKKIEYRVIIQEKYFEDKGMVKTQELDLGADGTIEERLITSPDEGYTFEKAQE